MMKKTLILSVVALCAATSVHAADLVSPEPAPPAVTEEIAAPATWDGGYVGIMGGGNWTKGDYDFGGADRNRWLNGGSLGAFAGWNHQLDNSIVLGLEGDFSYKWNEEDVRGRETGTDWSGSVRGRVGYAVMDNALLYGAAGYTVTRGYLDDASGDKDTKALHGYTVGAGVDYKFTENMFGRVEYRFNDYGSANIGGTDVDAQQHEALIGIGYKF
ncbi:outer membrane immunogenic protein [Rhizobium sp. SG_E_25_P2]|nr:outer membrane immunogenic protein [Rhizobium sp. SG_E_25_P2]